ncbi:transposase [Streptomyces prunicolor]
MLDSSIREGARHDLPDARWTVLEPLLPTGKRPGRPPVHTNTTAGTVRIHTKRRLIDGIRWRTRAGVPWRDVPRSTGPGSACTGSLAGGSSTGSGPRSSPRSRHGPKPPDLRVMAFRPVLQRLVVHPGVLRVVGGCLRRVAATVGRSDCRARPPVRRGRP